PCCLKKGERPSKCTSRGGQIWRNRQNSTHGLLFWLLLLHCTQQRDKLKLKKAAEKCAKAKRNKRRKPKECCCMLEAIRERREQKGCTLVERIVVLGILAIRAAMLVPTMTGYIDRANQDKLVAETRMIVMAAQTIASEQYGAGDAGETIN